MKIICALYLLTMLKVGLNQVIDNTVADIKETLDLLHEGDENIKISTPGGEKIYVLGSTGSWKSTLVHLLAGSPNHLQSIKIDESNGYIIKRISEDKFGNVTSKSKTKYPDLTIDENNVPFYDCPGFSDNPNTSIEITTNYLMKKVINSTESLKMVFVVEYHMMLKGNKSRNDFAQIIKHATQFVKNVKPYSDGIILVASKVPSLQGPDGKLIKKIRGFIKGYRQYISDERNSSEDISNELDLIDTFLTNERITLFKRPPVSGVISEIPETMQNRLDLLESVHKKIKFVKMNREDFGYGLSDRSKLRITGLSKEINRRITNIFDQINRRVIDHYSNNYGNYNNIEKLHFDLDHAIKILSKISVKTSLSTYLSAMNQLNIQILQGNLEDIKNYLDYLKFLQSVHDQPIIRRLSEWGRSLENSLEYLNNEQNWCLFAKHLFHRLSEFDVQSNTLKYDVEDIKFWGQGDNKNTGHGIFITHENFNDFLNKFVDTRLVENVKPSISKIQLLNNILNITLKSKPITSCYDNKLVLKGTFVKFSDLQKYRRDCKRVRLVEVFALSTIFFDMNLKENVDLVLFAPKWHVAMDIGINLDGPKGSDYDTVNYADGLPGMPGQNAKDFFGYGEEVVNGESLTISAVGGNGGRGQDGCNGQDGQEINIPADGTDGEYLNGYVELISNSNYDDIGLLYFNRKYWAYETFQSSFHCPGINGIGGSGGLGGSGGTVQLDRMPGIKVITANGRVGTPGTAGQCGKIYSRVELKKTKRKSCSFWIFCSSKVTWSGEKFEDPKCLRNCRDSTQVSIKGISRPTPKEHLNAAPSVNQYKSFARENLHSMPINRKQVETFLRSIEKNAEIRSIYDTKTLIDDFFQIEKQFNVLKKETNVSEFYELLLERILEYVTKRSNDLRVNERRTLANLYTAGLSKICKLRSGTEQSLIIDIESYLDVAMDHIRLVEKTGKQVAMKEFQNEYRRNLEMKMNDTRGIIVMEIVPEIEKLNLEIDTMFENLLDEVLLEKNSVASNVERYNQLRKQLQDSVDLRVIFKFLKTVTGVIRFFDKFASVMSTTVNTVNQVAAAFTDDHTNLRPSENMSYELIDEFKNNHFQLENSVQLNKQRKSEFLLNIVDEVLTMATGFSFSDILKPITRVKNILNGERKVDLSCKEIDLFQVKVRNIIGNKTHQIETQSRQNETNSLKALRKIVSKLSVLEMDVDLFSKFSSDEQKLHEIEAAVRHSQERLFNLKNLERNFLQFVDPFVKYVQSLFNQLPKNFMEQTMSSEVMKWQIQNKLKEIRFQMQQASGKLKLQYELLHTIDKLDGAISTLIDIFDRMQIYEEQVKLSNYIANIESADYFTDGSNPDLNKLKVIIQSNVILTIFDNAVNGFKQTIFPFAGFYLRRFDLPGQLLTGTNLETLVKESSQELKNLKMTLKEYQSVSINENDNIIHTADFSSNFKSSQPFYLWSGEEHYEIIEKLLAGQAVTIKSDITKGLKWNAVKYQNLEIHLKSTNHSEQANLDKFLKYFDVTIVHHGNSYYRCDNKFYLITSPVQCIEYSFEKDVNGLPIRRNNVYDKMRTGDFTLSPYALLTISLTAQKPDKVKSLNSDFLRTVNLELIGRGKYLDPNVDVCMGLEKYYAADEIVNDFHEVNSF